MISLFNPPRLTRTRMIVAMAAALVADAIQMVLGPVGMVILIDDVLDFVAAGIIMMAVGFHPLLLPTFFVELIPGVDMIPTWTGCTIAVLALRKRAENRASAPPSAYASASNPDPERMKRAQVLNEQPPGTSGQEPPPLM